MKSVSADFLSAIKATEREIKAKVEVLWTDPFVLSGNTATTTDENHTSWHDPHTIDTITTTPHKYLVLDGTCTCDGTFYAAPYTDAEQQNNQFGWYSNTVADGSGDFSPYPVLRVTFAEVRAVQVLNIIGEPTIGQYPVDFEVDVYNESDVLLHNEPVTGNTDIAYVMDLTSEGINTAKYMELTVKKWSDVDTVAKIVEFFGVITDSFYGDDIVSMGLLEEREIKDGSLPIGNISSNELDLELQNIKLVRGSGAEITDPFFPDNSDSYVCSSITPNVRITAYLGVKLPDDSVEYSKIGVFWTNDWVVDDDSFSAKVSARDRLDLLKNVDFRFDEILVNKTLTEIAEHILNHAKEHIPLSDLTWSIDSELDNYVVPYVYFGKMNYAEALAKVAEACLGQCYMSKDDVLIIESFQANATGASDLTITRSEYFSRKQAINSSDLKNHVEVLISPLEPESEESKITTTDDISFGAGDTDIEDYLIEWGDDIYSDVDATIEDESGITVSITEENYYPWGCVLSFHKDTGTSGTFKVKTTGIKYSLVKPTKVIRPIAEDEPSDSQRLYGKKEYEYKENFLIQDSSIATTIATRLLESYADPRSDVIVDWIGNPALELGDVIHVPVYTPNATGVSVYDDFVIYRQQYSFDGELRCTTQARKLISFTDTTTTTTTSGA